MNNNKKKKTLRKLPVILTAAVIVAGAGTGIAIAGNMADSRAQAAETTGSEVNKTAGTGNVELTLNNADGVITLPRAGEDTQKLDFTLKIDGKVVTDPEILKDVKVEAKDVNEKNSETLEKSPVVKAADDAKAADDVTVEAANSGVAQVELSYNGETSTNSVTAVVPGDINRDGYVSVSDLVVLRMEIDEPGSVKDAVYAEKLSDMDGNDKIDENDFDILCAMIRGELDYDNSLLKE